MKSRIINLVKPEVRALSAYTLKPYAYRHKMNQNENPLGYPDDLKAKVLQRVAEADWARYPDFDLVELTAKLADHVSVTPDMVLVGNGSNELIYVTLAAMLTRGDHVVAPVPTFSLYKIISRVVAESGALVLIDEAYREFSTQDFRPLLDEFDNVVLFRTFSKAMATGGLRVGYALTNPALAREIHKAKLPYALNLFSEMAAIVAIEHYDCFVEAIETLKQERTRVYAALQTLGLSSLRIETIPSLYVYPSAANFFLVRFNRPARSVFNFLLNEYGILIRDISQYPGLAGHLRVSLGTPEENNLFIKAISRLCFQEDYCSVKFVLTVYKCFRRMQNRFLNPDCYLQPGVKRRITPEVE